DEGRLHLSWDHFLLETLDEALREPVPTGERGVGVLTTLTREAEPLVRFVLGDYLKLHADHACPCGRQSPVIEHFGRDLNRFRMADRYVYVRDLEQRLLTAPVEAIGDLWLIEIAGNEVRFRAEARRPDPRLYHRLEEAVGDELGIRLKIEGVPKESL